MDARIIFKVRHLEWVSNLVPVRKKSREIRLCVDFRNLNRTSDKDIYKWFQVLQMQQILQMVSSSELFSLLDGFSGYNQVLVAEEDRLKNDIQDHVGNFCLQKDALWTHKRWIYFPEGYGHSFSWSDWPQCCSIPR